MATILPNSGLKDWSLTDKPKMVDFNDTNLAVEEHATILKTKLPRIAENGHLMVWNPALADYESRGLCIGEQGIQGIQGFKGDKGDTGEQGPMGAKGDKGDTGPVGPQGIQGPKGDKGDMGEAFSIKGLFASLSALQSAKPVGSEGDIYAVGTAASNVIYIWDTTVNQWISIGDLQGPQGIQGPVGPIGPQGVQGPIGPQGIPGAAKSNMNATLTAAGWSAAAPFTQTVSVPGVLATDTPHVAVMLSGDLAAQKQQKKAYNQMDRVQSGAGSLTFTCLNKKPEIALDLEIEVIR